jgi:integrase
MERQAEGPAKRKRVVYKKYGEAKLALAEVENLQSHGRLIPEVIKERSYTLSDLVVEYACVCHGQKSFKSAKQYFLANLLHHFNPGTRLLDISPAAVENYFKLLWEKPIKHGGQRSVASHNIELCCVNNMFEFAVHGLRWLRHNPVSSKALKKRGAVKRKRYLKEPHVLHEMLFACTGERAHLRPVVMFGAYLGLRPGREMLQIRWRDVDFEANTVTVTRNKTGHVQVLAMPVEIRRMLRNMHAKAKPAPEGHVILYQGRPVRNVSHAFRNLCRDLEVEDFRLHDLRHSYASALFKATNELKVVQKALGHSDLKTTTRYLHQDEEEATVAAAAAIGKVWEMARNGTN